MQGEDGFPGFKGDMGIKGDRVSFSGQVVGGGGVAEGGAEGQRLCTVVTPQGRLLATSGTAGS